MDHSLRDQRIAVLIRRARATDAPTLSAFAAGLFRETYRPTAAPVDLEAYIAGHFRPDMQEREIANPDQLALLAEIDGELVGYAQLQRGPAPASVQLLAGGSGKTVEIRRFYVAPSWHGQGVAQQLMAASLEARERDMPVWLGVFTYNVRAIAFYTKCGFRIAGETTFYMGETPERDYVMVWNNPD